MDTQAFIDYLTARTGYAGQVVHVEHLPAREAHYGALEHHLPRELRQRLEVEGLLPLYSHQADAVSHAVGGENVMVSTSSASGKTLCYNIPVLVALGEKARARALYLFPTKALAQDQLQTLRELAEPQLLGKGDIDTFDGDTPRGHRAEIRGRARVILTNPDMLHLGILPNHQAWARFLRNLRYVVVDEGHVYRGVFGSHVACVLRRLRRLCRLYGSNPQFICCSATIANPAEHVEKLVGLPFHVVEGDGSPHQGRDFAFWNPPLLDETKSTRRSANSEATDLFTELVKQDIRTLAFARTRRLTELIYIYSRDRLAKYSPAWADRIMAYRAGYLPEERRRIEGELFSGALTGVVATNALELGIDIGDLEATVLTGYPGSIASTWQQAGRSGRGGGRALSILVGLDNPLDQYFMNNPTEFFGKGFENALVNPANTYILKSHLLCAAWEMPLGSADKDFFGDTFLTEIMELEGQGLLRKRRGGWYPSPSISCPAHGIGIRSTSAETYAVVETVTGALLETVEAGVAFMQVHPGAIYLHQGDSYLVTDLDIAARTAHVRLADVNYYTQSKDLTDLTVFRVTRRRDCGGVGVSLGDVEVSTTVVGFKRKTRFTEEVIGEEVLDLPPYCFDTVALWFDIPPRVIEEVEAAHLDMAGGLHALEHAAIGILPLFALCDRNDIGGVSTTLHPDTGRPQVFIYDAYPGGIGISERGFDIVEELWRATLKVIAECPCLEGCPSCIQSPKCGNNNKPLDKVAAQVLLRGLIGER